MATENDFITPAGLYVYETANVVGNTTSSDMYAEITESLSQPSVMFDFYKSKKLDSRLEFTRATIGSYYDADGILSYAAVNEPRFDYDPVTGISKGLLIEEARTNLLTYSEQFDNASWSIGAATITSNATTAPDGSFTADLFVEDTNNNSHSISPTVNINIGTNYTFSVYARAGTRSVIELAGLGFSAQGYTAIFDLSTGLMTSNIGGFGKIINAGNGWYRCQFVVTASGGSTPVIYLNNGTSSVYTGDGTSGIYVWGAQLEVGPCATSYIPTIASTVTRSQDVTFIKDDNFSSWYTANCVVYVEVSGTNVSTPPYPVIFHLDNDESTSFIGLIYYGGSPNLGNISVRTSNGITYNENVISSGTVVNDTFCKIAVLINNQPGNTSNYITGYVNGVGTTFTNSALPTDITRLRIGTYRYDQQLNGHIKKIAFYQLTGTNATANSLMAMTL